MLLRTEVSRAAASRIHFAGNLRRCPSHPSGREVSKTGDPLAGRHPASRNRFKGGNRTVRRRSTPAVSDATSRCCRRDGVEGLRRAIDSFVDRWRSLDHPHRN